jgi:hypothetical protein
LWSYNPGLPLRVDRFRLIRVRSPLLAESLLFSLPPGTEMVHFPGFASPSYVFRGRYSGLARCGFPHSEIPGSQPACGSPRRIVACHVLHRLSAPRHPPYALSSLTIKFTQDCNPCGLHGIALRVLVVCALTSSDIRLSKNAKTNSWWAWVELNHRPHPYQGCALAI